MNKHNIEFEKLYDIFSGIWNKHRLASLQVLTEWRKAVNESGWTDAEFDKELDKRQVEGTLIKKDEKKMKAA